MHIDPEKTIFLIDGSSFLYRAYYSLRPLHTSQGTPVHAVFGFCRMIKKLIDTWQAQYVGLVWDSPGKTKRHDLFPEYKATRQAAPSDLFTQKDLIIECAKLIGLATIAKTGVEADDIMFSIAQEQEKKGFTIIMITADKDMRQALTKQIVIYDPLQDLFITTTSFEEKKDYPVEKIPFFFALVGDSSDNIPGVPGIGVKTATDLIKQFKSLDDLYDNLEKVSKARTQKALSDHKKEAYLSYKLFLLQYQKSGIDSSELQFDSKNWIHARSFFEQLEFNSFLKEIGQYQEVREHTIQEKITFWKQKPFSLVTTQQELSQLCTLLEKTDTYALDTETDGKHPLDCLLVGISLSTADHAWYIPCNHDNHQTTNFENIRTLLQPILADTHKKLYLHHAKYDKMVLFSHGITIASIAQDTLIAANLVIKEWQSASLKKLSLYYFNESMLTYDELVTDQKLRSFAQVPLDHAYLYACTDAYQTFRLVPILEKEVQEQHMEKLYHTLELPLMNVLFDMECEGICLDETVLKKLDKKVVVDLAHLEEKILTLTGHTSATLNLNSPKQIEQLLFYNLKLPPQKKSSKTGSYSTDVTVLQELAKIHPVPGLIIQHRELSKLKSTYIDALPSYVNKKTGRIHTTFSQTGVATGRLSSSNPNLQNIPANGIGLDVRAAFIPKKDHLFISADYSQIELRILAHVSQDQLLCDAFLHNRDIHQETAAVLFDVPLAHVTSEQRKLGKRINFSVLYGLTPYGLSKELDIPFADAKKYIAKYFDQYKTVAAWMEETVECAKKNGYVSTVWGRRRYVAHIHEKNQTLYQEARRVAINTVAQGTAADIMKKGMLDLHTYLEKEKIDAQLILQIHDELLISAHTDAADLVEKAAVHILEKVVTWNIPLQVNTRQGKNWKEVSK